MEKMLNFDAVASKYSKANKDATKMAKTKLQKRAELNKRKGELDLQLLDEREALEQAMITPGKDLIDAYEQVTLTEARVNLIDDAIGNLFGDDK